VIREVVADLAAFLLVFAVCWGFFLVSHVLCASLGIVRGVDRRTVALATLSACIVGILTWLWAGSLFSTVNVQALVSVVAPFSFLGFCGIYILIGPVTVDRSITLSILSALEASETKGLDRRQLQDCVPFDRIFEKRMRELERSGTLSFGDQVMVTPRGARILRLYIWLGRMFRVDFQ